MSHIHISKPTAPIQLFEQKNQTTNTRARQERIPEHQKPQSVEFRSIFAPQWGSSEIVVQRMDRGASAKVEDQTLDEFFNFMTSLKTDRLNVVGENHVESEKRRKEEKEFCSKYAKSSNYWLEYEFPRTIDESGHGLQADPDSLKVFLVLQYLIEWLDDKAFEKQSGSYEECVILTPDFQQKRKSYWERVVYILRILSNKILKYLSQTVLDDSTRIQEGTTRDLIDALTKHRNIFTGFHTKNQANQNEYNAVLDQELIINIQYLHPFFNSVQSAYIHAYVTEKNQLDRLVKISNTTPENEKVLPQAKEAIETAGSNYQKKLNELITAIKTIKLVDDPSLTSDEINQERSKLMHLAAQENHKVRGVWKIGGGHAEEIEEILQGSEDSGVRTPLKFDYNLVTKEKFNQALKNATAYEIWVKSQSEEIAGVHQYARKSGTHP